MSMETLVCLGGGFVIGMGLALYGAPLWIILVAGVVWGLAWGILRSNDENV